MAFKKVRSSKINIPELNVNITSLMDILTVLLFFLIKSFAVSSTSIIPPDDLRLPAAVTEEQVEESVTVMLSQSKLYFNEQPLLQLKNRTFRPEDVGADKRTIVKLKNLLDVEYKKKMAIFKGAGDTSFLPPGKVIIQADKEMKFATVKYLLHTVARAGYTDYQFVVKNDN